MLIRTFIIIWNGFDNIWIWTLIFLFIVGIFVKIIFFDTIKFIRLMKSVHFRFIWVFNIIINLDPIRISIFIYQIIFINYFKIILIIIFYFFIHLILIQSFFLFITEALLLRLKWFFHFVVKTFKHTFIMIICNWFSQITHLLTYVHNGLDTIIIGVIN